MPLRILIISLITLLTSGWAKASVSSDITDFLNTHSYQLGSQRHIISISDELQNLDSAGQLRDDYLLCLKADMSYVVRRTGSGVCVSLVNGKRVSINISGVGLGLYVSGGASLIVYNSHPYVDQQLYSGFSIGGPAILDFIINRILRFKLGIGPEILFSRSQDYGRLLLLGIQYAAGASFMKLQVTLSKH